MFGKNYDEEIVELKKCIIEQDKQINKILEFIKENNKWIKKNQKNMLEIAKTQVQHKKAIRLLFRGVK